jgi:hypothetical protein
MALLLRSSAAVIGRARERRSARCLASRPRCAAASAATPDHSFALPGEAEVHLFGVEHLSLRPEVGDFILLNAPASVVVETALSAAHGERCGTRLTAEELSASPEEWHRIALNIGAHLQSQLSDVEQATDAPLWSEVRDSAPAEQVALVAALTVSSTLVYGDRPKEVTFRRLAACSASQLDASFCRQASSNFASLHGGEWDVEGEDVFDEVVLRERDRVLYHSLRTEARNVAANAEGKAVVGIVGSAHLEAVARMFKTAGGFLDDVEELLTLPEAPPSEDGSYGARRAILERLLSLRCPPEVAAEAVAALGELSFRHAAAYECTHQLYGSSRMLLAALPHEQLPMVVSSAKGGPQMWDLLQPLRACRPVHGGAGWSNEALDMLNALTPQL